MNCRIFSRLLNASAQITFWALPVKANFVFCLFNVFLRFRGQSAKKKVSAICHIQFQWKVTEHVWNLGLRKYGLIVQKSLLKKKYFEIKNSETPFCCLYVKLDTVKIWEQSNRFPLTCSSWKCPLLVKKLTRENSAEKFSCLANKLHPQMQSTGFSDNCQSQSALGKFTSIGFLVKFTRVIFNQPLVKRIFLGARFFLEAVGAKCGR